MTQNAHVALALGYYKGEMVDDVKFKKAKAYFIYGGVNTGAWSFSSDCSGQAFL